MGLHFEALQLAGLKSNKTTHTLTKMQDFRTNIIRIGKHTLGILFAHVPIDESQFGLPKSAVRNLQMYLT